MKQGQGISTISDVLAIEAAGIPPLPASTYEMLCAGANLDPDAIALSFFLQAKEHRNPETWSCRQLLNTINRTANFFHSLGATKDTVIAFILPNLPETHFVIWGGQAAGIVAAINPLLEPTAIAELLNAAGATILVTLAPFPGTDLWPKVSKALPKVASLRHLVLVDLADRVRGPKHFLARLAQKKETVQLHGLQGIRKALPRGIRAHDFGSAIRNQNRHGLDSGRCIDPGDYSSFFCTGGTTGTPKIAMRTHRNEVANAWSVAQTIGSGMSNRKNVFCGLPLFHVNGVLVTGLIPFWKGAHVILGTPQGYRGEGVIPGFWEIVAHHQINFFSGVPTLYAGLLQVPIGHHRIDCLEYGLCGAAPMPVEVFRRFQDSTGLKILEGYGLTEGTCVSSVNPSLGDRRLGSIGIRIPGQQMKTVVLDAEGRYERDCRIDEAGVIAISGPNVFSGYRIPEQNKGLWIEAGDGQRWLNTGDLGRQDKDGYFWLTGRKKELIIRGGHNIDPASIEEPLHRHPAIQLAAAVGRPDAHAGEIPVAYVQLKPGAVINADELLAFAQSEIPERAAWPKQIRIVDQIPLTAVGKIYKPSLKHREIQDALSEALKKHNIEVKHIHVTEDKTLGTRVQVALAEDTCESAKRVLGQFPFAVRFEALEDISG